MRALRPGLWHWQAPHPDWSPEAPWDQAVSSYAIDDGERLFLFDPIAVPRQIEELVASRETAIVLTAPWHERDTQALVERLGVPVFAPPSESAEDLVRKYGISREKAGDGSPDLAWLRSGAVGVALVLTGDQPLAGIEAFPSWDSTKSCSGSKRIAR